jgi:hypothetical protein
MGFNRLPSPRVLAAAKGAPVELLITSQHVAAVERAADPFRIADRCECSETGDHNYIVSCGDLVCRHCSRVLWL